MNLHTIESKEITLKGLIADANMTQREFSKLTGIPEVTINSWVSQKRMPKLDSAVLLCCHLKISLKTLAKSLDIDVSNLPDDLPISEPSKELTISKV
ncbi:helix-turn-helix domain-containing protein [Aphanothece sacrum]|uniref:Helix-turn-helix domain protein n=1 Tax=Aphanothece sacrum FPU1 TaxID=1920663 RepID=A0A401INZ4_APHSA|nr:helix-turn-helix transcriptional regulator [Aphanothece sacrum]GBF82961.1 helix-turn-helix domain protein [Aphanothece sacrum FPU1]